MCQYLQISKVHILLCEFTNCYLYNLDIMYKIKFVRENYLPFLFPYTIKTEGLNLVAVYHRRTTTRRSLEISLNFAALKKLRKYTSSLPINLVEFCKRFKN